MTSLYPSAGADGPWALDDTAVLMDGYLNNGALAGNHPTVDGVASRRADIRGGLGGLTNGQDAHLTRGHDSNRSRP